MQGLVFFFFPQKRHYFFIVKTNLESNWNVLSKQKRVNRLNGKRPMKRRAFKSWSFLSCLPWISYLLSLRPISPIFNRDKTNTYLHGFAVKPKLSNMRESAYPISTSKDQPQLDLVPNSAYWMKAFTYTKVFNNSTNIYF